MLITSCSVWLSVSQSVKQIRNTPTFMRDDTQIKSELWMRQKYFYDIYISEEALNLKLICHIHWMKQAPNMESHLADCEAVFLWKLWHSSLSLFLCMHACGLINGISSHFVFIFMRFHFSPLFTKKSPSKLINSVSLGRDPSIFPTPNWIDLGGWDGWGGGRLVFSKGAICARFPLWINVKSDSTRCCRCSCCLPSHDARANEGSSCFHYHSRRGGGAVC